ELAGFSASVGYFEDDEWGAALRYKKEWGKVFDVGAGIGYSKNTDERYQSGGGGEANGPFPPPSSNFVNFRRDVQDWAGSGSIKHEPTGLFVFSAFSFSQTHDTNTIHSGFYTGTSAPLMNAWDVQAGIQRDFSFLGLNKLGETSFWG